MTHKNQLKILFVEDLPSDVDLAVLALRKEKLKFEYTTVFTRADLIKALNEFKPDLIISDYMMPAFNGLQALMEVKEFNPEIPFILCTGSVNEETAVECIKAGADDYVIKEHMTRLPFAVKEALEQHMIRIEKRAAELLLKENEEKLQSIFRVTPVGMGLAVKRVIIEVNDTFCKMTGYDRKELIGKSTEMVIPTREEYEFISLEENRQIAEKGIGSVETRLKCKDGRILNIISAATPLDSCDLSKGLTFTVMDITERKQAEEALLQSQHLFQTLAQVSPVGIFRTDADGYTTYVNPKWIELSGLSSEEALGTGWINAVHPEDREKLSEGWVNNLKSRNESSAEYRFLKPDGSIIWVMGKAVPELIGNEVTGYIGTITDITDRKSMEVALHKSEERFRNMYNDAIVGLYRTNLEGKILLGNRALVKMLGFQSFEELSTRNLKEEGFESSNQRQQFIDQIEKEGEIKDLETTWICRDGKKIFVRENAKAVCDSDGKILYYDGSVEDITERKQAEEALVESETKYRQLVTQSPDGIFIIDLSGKFLSANRAICESLNYTEEELLSMKMNDIVPEKYHSLHKQRLMAILNGEGTNTYAEYEVIGKDGIAHFVEVISVPYYKGKEIIGFQGIARDISERKLAEEELKTNQTQLMNALKLAHLGSWEYDVENDSFIFNDLFYAIFRTTAEKVGGYTMTSADYANRFVHPEDIAIVGLETRKAIETDDPNFSRQLEHRIIYADGETGYITVRFFVVKNEKGKTVRTYGVNQDITELKRVEVELSKAAGQMKLAKEKAEASDKLKTTFLNNISHEVRTPLNGILGFAEIMSQANLSEDEKTLSLSMLFQSSDRLLSTITNYMDISLITSETMVLYNKNFSPGQVLRENLQKNQMICLAKNLDLSLKIPAQGEKLSIRSDPEILRKIITHLLNNAIKFTEKGSISFGYEIHRNELEFFVKDTGIGIGKESLKDIFEHFVKEDRGPLKVTEGSGLGLSISKGLVELVGGKIRVESEKGKGSSFFFTIPVEKEFENHVLDSITDKYDKNKVINSILVAEDDEINFFYLKSLLKQYTSANIIHASDGREAVELFKANPGIELILMDIKMPEIDGLEATRQIKLIKQNIPVIAITAYAMTGDEEKALEAGCDGYIAKPINKKILFEKISEFVNIKSVPAPD